MLTPLDLLAVKRQNPARFPLLLESSAQALDPSARSNAAQDLLFATTGEGLYVSADGLTRDMTGQVLEGTFLECLRRAWRAQGLESDVDETTSTRHCGWALYLSYELAGQLEPTLTLPRAPGGGPVALALRCPVVLVRDAASGELSVQAETGHDALLHDVLADARAAQGAAQIATTLSPLQAMHEAPPDDFLRGVEQALHHLREGNSYQINLSRGWVLNFAGDVAPHALQQRLRTHNPAPFSGLLTWHDWAVASSSPERLVALTGDRLDTRPIAGTRPRTGDDHTARREELLGSAKERAEHTMLVDLQRNDLGRVAAPGSVAVDEFMAIESYAHVHHIVSNVHARLRAGLDAIDVVEALFPGGTITGCPKVRTMQLIAQLEGEGRGTYTGAIGWLGQGGDMDLNILIRSAEIAGSRVRFRTGAGIVLGSKPHAELAETRAKARGLLRALGVTS